MNHLRLFILTLCLLGLTVAPAQVEPLGPNAQISVITCGPGTDLYAQFGHSAFRVRDPDSGIDWVYNYGTFDFDTPNFYMKFARGKLQYALSRSTFAAFLYTYQLESRWVREQLLGLDPGQRMALFRFLEENNRPENRYYQYDFLYENCATKIPEVLTDVLGTNLVLDPGFASGGESFRDLIQQNLQSNTWSSLGIDLALGAVVDRVAEPYEYRFLPENVRLLIQNTTLDGQPLSPRERVILDLPNPKYELYLTATPLFWCLLLLVFTATISWIDYRNGSRSRLLDFLLFLLTGLAGLLIGFLWFFTDHTSTVWNFNILWAFPVNIALAFVLLKDQRPDPRLQGYLIGLLALIGCCLLLWATGLQEFHPIVSVIWAALALRYLLLLQQLRRAKPLKRPQ
ncbi:DUF4105 domain-containing protein [Robiginitalea sp. SC105]|uniref:Lnb N-terminal periplasmic domain-containing protein n=1 Tax=Robiginitalea sp. SC105 TaxID=2762332 RepID=UPI001639C27D|nr:DUF4105 domain-containing protein [Robiginitalea sp. SC105]MBC2840003.1 DUF4105 domain-containing protein [Robiginitalea sp. SC105]